MKKYINRLKYWLFVRRFHIDDIKVETNHHGHLDVIAMVKGHPVVLGSYYSLTGVSDSYTDFGIALRAKNKNV